MSHSPGPWELGPAPRRDVIYDADDNYIAEVDYYFVPIPGSCLHYPCFYGDPTAEANARLIAAAPDLLASLKELRELARNFTVLDVGFSDGCFIENNKALDAASAAIAKAEITDTVSIEADHT